MPVPYNPFGEKMLPDGQPEPPLVLLEAISSCAVAGCFGKEVNFLKPHFREVSDY